MSESEIDGWVSAQLPDPEDTAYFELVTTHMLHGPCGAANPSSPCMVKNKFGKMVCRANYPKSFNEKTYIQANGYPVYCRPDNGRTYFSSLEATAMWNIQQVWRL